MTQKNRHEPNRNRPIPFDDLRGGSHPERWETKGEGGVGEGTLGDEVIVSRGAKERWEKEGGGD